MRVTFITSNPGKLREAMAYLSPLGIEVHGLKFSYPEIQADSLEEVAAYGVEWLSKRIDGPFFLDDSGLFIDALKGFPGVYSAYVYKTLGVDGILKIMEGVKDRRAHFKSVIAYWDGEVHIFTGRIDGKIALEKRGSRGFGFDPIFIPEGYERTFAEMTTEEKNRISHRGRAFEAFSNWLRARLKIG